MMACRVASVTGIPADVIRYEMPLPEVYAYEHIALMKEGFICRLKTTTAELALAEFLR